MKCLRKTSKWRLFLVFLPKYEPWGINNNAGHYTLPKLQKLTKMRYNPGLQGAYRFLGKQDANGFHCTVCDKQWAKEEAMIASLFHKGEKELQGIGYNWAGLGRISGSPK